MKASLIQIGNSRGLRIPKSLLAQCNLKDEVELEVKNSRLIITSPRKSRKGWKETFEKMRANQDDFLLMQDTLVSEWDKKEWKW